MFIMAYGSYASSRRRPVSIRTRRRPILRPRALFTRPTLRRASIRTRRYGRRTRRF